MKSNKSIAKKSGASRSQSQRKSRISRRIVSPRRHTLGFVVDGKELSRSEVVKMARAGMVSGVRVVGNHIQTATEHRLADLPLKISTAI